MVPKPDDLVDETISTWIEEDLQKLGVENEKHWEDIASIKAYRRGKDEGKVGTRRVMQSATPASAGGHRVEEEPGSASSLDLSATGSTILAVSDLQPIKAASAGAAVEVAAPLPIAESAPAPAPRPTMPAAPAAPVVPQTVAYVAPPVAAVLAPPPRGEAVRQYPNSLRVDPMRPHLVVVQCDQSGVSFAFDSAHLENIGFRTSMPIRCVFSGDTERRKLFARPVAFIDRSGARIRSPQEIESKHTTTLLSGQTPRDLLDIMGNIDALPKPFSFCMPYYGSTEFSHVSLKCWTETRGDGGFNCYVMIPNGSTALAWLHNVNGSSGPEYAMLENDIGLFDNDAWRQLGDECRRRLAVWCPFEPMEQFRLYLSDGDFGSRDKGLAGIVVTDRRLIYCKYHHRGAVELAEPGTLLVRDDTDFAQLAIENRDGKTKLAKLHDHDVPVLLAALAHLPHLTVDRKPAAATAANP